MWICFMFFAFFVKTFINGSGNNAPVTKVLENDSLLLPCYLQTENDDISSKQPSKIKWYKNEEFLLDSTINPDENKLERYNLWPNGSLQIHRVNRKDSGKYNCEIVRPPPWSSIKQTFIVQILQPPTVNTDPRGGFLRVKIGETIWMSCNPKGVPYPLITWYKDGEEMKLLDHRETLKFTATDKNLSGTYTCVAKNGIGKSASADIKVTIKYPPELITNRSVLYSTPGIKAEFQCKVSANPQATVKWFKGNKTVQLDNRIITMENDNQHLLIIRNVTFRDFGEYTCRAENNMGHGDVHFQLTGVSRSPSFKIANQHNINTRKSFKLIWEVESYLPIIEYLLSFRIQNGDKWKKLYIPAEESSGYVHSKMYIFEGLNENTIYEAFVIARNSFGWSKPSHTFLFATDGAEVRVEEITKVTLIDENEIFPTPSLTILNNRGSFIHSVSIVFPMIYLQYTIMFF